MTTRPKPSCAVGAGAATPAVATRAKTADPERAESPAARSSSRSGARGRPAEPGQARCDGHRDSADGRLDNAMSRRTLCLSPTWSTGAPTLSVPSFTKLGDYRSWRDADAHARSRMFERSRSPGAFLRHVVVPVVVPRLNTGQPMRLQMPPDLATDAVGRKQRLEP
jgi:hypothetical protein